MRDRLDELGDKTTVVMVTFTDPKNLDGYLSAHDLPFPVLVDPDRSMYRAYGLDRGSVLRVWGWKAAKRYLEILRRGGWRELRKPTEDTLQLGGDFIVGPDGTLAWGFWGEGPDDRPSVDELITQLRDIPT